MTRRNPQTGVTIPEIVISVALLIGVFVIFSTRSQEFMKKTKRSGAEVRLKQIERSLKSYFTERSTFPEGNSKQPDRPCCDYPSKRCPLGEPHDQVWRELDVMIDDPRYQFEYRGTGTGTGSEVTVIATGDPDCDGDVETFTMRGTTKGGYPEFTITSSED